MLNSKLYLPALRRIWLSLFLAFGCLLAGTVTTLRAQSYSQGFDASFKWGRNFGFDSTSNYSDLTGERVTGLAADAEGGVFVAGRFTRRMRLGDTTLTCYTCTEAEITTLDMVQQAVIGEGYLARVDSAGQFRWGLTLGGPGSSFSTSELWSDLACAVVADPVRRRVYVAGGASPPVNDTLLKGTGYISRIGDREIPGSGPYLACFDFNGKFLWARTLRGCVDGAFTALAFDARNGRLYAAGTFLARLRNWYPLAHEPILFADDTLRHGAIQTSPDDSLFYNMRGTGLSTRYVLPQLWGDAMLCAYDTEGRELWAEAFGLNDVIDVPQNILLDPTDGSMDVVTIARSTSGEVSPALRSPLGYRTPCTYRFRRDGNGARSFAPLLQAGNAQGESECPPEQQNFFNYVSAARSSVDGGIYLLGFMIRNFQVFDWNGRPVMELPCGEAPHTDEMQMTATNEMLLRYRPDGAVDWLRLDTCKLDEFNGGVPLVTPLPDGGVSVFRRFVRGTKYELPPWRPCNPDAPNLFLWPQAPSELHFNPLWTERDEHRKLTQTRYVYLEINTAGERYARVHINGQEQISGFITAAYDSCGNFWWGGSVGFTWQPPHDFNAREAIEIGDTALGCKMFASDDNLLLRFRRDGALAVAGGLNSPSGCAGDDSGALAAIVTGGKPPYLFRWNDGATDSLRTGLPPGRYTLTVVDGRSCSRSIDWELQAIATPGPALRWLPGDTDPCRPRYKLVPMVTGGRAPYRFLWNDGVTDSARTNLSPGKYRLTLIDANGCTQSFDTTITAINLLNVLVDVTHPTCFNAEDGSILLTVSGGKQPYQYQWNTGQNEASLENIGAGVYRFTVTDANGCTYNGSASLNNSSKIEIQKTVYPPGCYDESNGRITLILSGGEPPYNYIWKDGSTSNDRSNLSRGKWEVTITDGNGCVVIWDTTLIAPARLRPLAETVAPTCSYSSDGYISLKIEGGTPPYALLWNDGSSSLERRNLPSNTYSITISDANDCVQVAGIELFAPPPLSVIAQIQEPTDSTAKDGRIQIEVEGGVSPYQYSWNDGTMDAVRGDLGVGDYVLTVVDAKGCILLWDTMLVVPNARYLPDNSHKYVRIRPNPARDVVVVEYNLPAVAIVVSDVQGRTLYRQPLASAEGRLEIEVRNWAPGVYICRFTGTDGHIVRALNLSVTP